MPLKSPARPARKQAAPARQTPVRFSINLRAESHARLAALARDSGLTMTAIVEHLIARQDQKSLLASARAGEVKAARPGRPKQSFHR